MNILLFGHPGSGKTTHGRYIADQNDLSYLSTGDLVREIAQKDSELAHEVKAQMEAGWLIGDELMWRIIKDKIDGQKDKLVLDGYPRTVKQLESLEKDGIKIDLVVYIHLDHEVSYERLMKRGRTDDTTEKIKVRMERYRESTKPLVQEFVDRGVPVIHIDNKFSVKQVQKNINDRLKEYL
jgi:adenylate kinase